MIRELGIQIHLVAFAFLQFYCINAQSTGIKYDPAKDICHRSGHSAAVVGDYLYLDGGRIILQESKPRTFTNTILARHNLSTTFRDGENLKFPPILSNLTRGAEVPSVVGGILWADNANGRLFSYGGEFEQFTEEQGIPFDFAVWSYDTWNDTWTELKPKNTVVDYRVSYGAGTSVEYQGKGYYLGGWRSKNNDNRWSTEREAQKDLLIYDMLDNSWQKRSGPRDGLARAEGAMTYIPGGDNGILVYFGGVVSEDGKEENASAVLMSQIELYDIQAEFWYTQNATGEIPEMRSKFCAGAVAAPDSSSYNIYIYGGKGFGENLTGFDDVYVLSIPSFKWIKLYPPLNTVGRPHYDLTCSIVRNGQIIVIGGIFPLESDAGSCDAPEIAGVHNGNLGYVGPERDFWEEYDTNLKDYTVPPAIYKVIGGGPEGNAQIREPERGFSELAVKTLTQKTATLTERKPTRIPSTDAGQSKTNLAIIVGPAVGGVILIAVLLGAIIFFWRKRKREAEKARSASRPISELPSPHYESLPPAYHSPFTPQVPQNFPFPQTSPPASPGVDYSTGSTVASIQTASTALSPQYQQYPSYNSRSTIPFIPSGDVIHTPRSTTVPAIDPRFRAGPYTYVNDWETARQQADEIQAVRQNRPVEIGSGRRSPSSTVLREEMFQKGGRIFD